MTSEPAALVHPPGRMISWITAEARSTAKAAHERATRRAAGRAQDMQIRELMDLLATTPFHEMAQLAADEAPIRALAHTIDLNDAAVADVILRTEDPLVLAYAVATLTQSALHTIIDPRSNHKRRHLASAKRAGTFFTPPDIAFEMAQLAIANRSEVRSALEPASGTAMLTAALLTAASQMGTSISHVTTWELSPYLAEISNRVLHAVAERLNIAPIIEVRSGDAITLFEAQTTTPDLIVMNPPYGRIKYLRSEATNAETRATDSVAAIAAGQKWVNATQQSYAATASRLGLRERGLDHQRIFMAASMDALAPDGVMACITPSSWTSGPQSKDIRETLLRGRKVSEIVFFPEDAKLFPTVNQPTAIVVADRSGGHETIDVELRSRVASQHSKYQIEYMSIFNSPNDSLHIPMVHPEMRSAYALANALPTISDCNVKNARGELDLTVDKWMLAVSGPGARVVRGDHVERYRLYDVGASKKQGTLSEAGMKELRTRAKWPDVMSRRIVGRQVAYMAKPRRLTFTEVEVGTVVANSCNYLVATDPTTHSALLGFLNSAPAEWWFRLHSSNNHVSNGEIAGLPWPLQERAILEAVSASAAVRSNIGTSTESRLARRTDRIIDALVCFGMGWTSANARSPLSSVLDSNDVEEVVSLIDWFRRYGIPSHLRDTRSWLQHELNTLSELDYEMIRHVPIGGNWQQIPESVPSNRLKQIREMSAERGVVRTTYYGRLRPDQPSYTVATYYNRPGNGTNIHPYEDRTLSHREAARLQSFPDSYAFIGGDGAVRTQIGNAVPPLLGRAVADRLLQERLDSGPVVDLFAGAGGLSLGFELAGMRVAVAADNNESALRTYAFNRPTESIADPKSGRTLLVGADLSDPRTRQDVYASIRQKLGGVTPAALIGGPPCQGFSHAGFRDPDDPRSDLAVAFLDFVEALKPASVVLENVEGLLTARKGKVVQELIDTLRELGYPVASPWVLAAEQFGVPQMRRRVFLVATRGKPVDPPVGFLDRCLGRREPQNVDRAGSYPVTVGEAFAGLPQLTASTYTTAPVGRRAYGQWVTGEVGSPNFVAAYSEVEPR